MKIDRNTFYPAIAITALLLIVVFAIIASVGMPIDYGKTFAGKHRQRVTEYTTSDVTKAEMVMTYRDLGNGAIELLNIQGNILFGSFVICGISSLIGLGMSIWLMAHLRRSRVMKMDAHEAEGPQQSPRGYK